MKKLALILLTGIICFGFTGCASFGEKKDYNEGDWYGLAGPDTVARIEQDKLALEKLRKSDIVSDPVLGYKGVVKNFSTNRYTFKLIGPETKSYFLSPGEKTEDYLIPGDYAFTIKKGGKKVGWGSFKVGPQIQVFENINYHWFVYADQ